MAEEGTTKKRTFDNDIFIIDVGRNDFWQKVPPTAVARDVKRLISFIRNKCLEITGAQPLFFVSKLLKTKRLFQQPFVDKVNKAFKEVHLPIGVDFSQLNPEIVIGDDGIHPTNSGYDDITSLVRAFIRGRAQKLSKLKRVDEDANGIYDNFEIEKFFTDPEFYDTDGDGYSDGDEVFMYKTEPLNVLSSPVAAP